MAKPHTITLKTDLLTLSKAEELRPGVYPGGRINALCTEFGYVGVNQSKGKQWCGSSEIGIHDWFHPRKTSA